jgi:hypothetical protein
LGEREVREKGRLRLSGCRYNLSMDSEWPSLWELLCIGINIVYERSVPVIKVNYWLLIFIRNATLGQKAKTVHLWKKF